MAHNHSATSSSTCPAARRSCRRPTCAMAICAPTRPTPAGVLEAVLRARDLVGSFEKPRYITFDDDLCAHARSRIVGCTRCLDLCPTGAIVPAGNHVSIDAHICAGCGQCAAACPTGAASYALPTVEALMRKLRAALTTYRSAGGNGPDDPRARWQARKRAHQRPGPSRRWVARHHPAVRRQRSNASRS